MAIQNEIYAARYASMIRKLFGMRGGNPTRQLAGEIAPVLPLFLGAEARFLEGWRRFGIAFSIAAVAGNVSVFRFRNPAGTPNSPPIIAVIEKLDLSEGAADTNAALRKGQTATDLAVITSTTGAQFDSRDGPGAATNLVLSQQNTTVGAPGIGGNEISIATMQILAGTMFPLVGTDIQEFIVSPGDAYQFNPSVGNQAVRATMWWRERVLEESERQ